MVAVFFCRCRPVPKRGKLFGALPALDDDVARVFEVAVVDLHVAGQHHTRPAFGPGLIKRHVGSRCAIAIVGKQLRHRGLYEPIGQHRAASQRNRRGKCGGGYPECCLACHGTRSSG